MFLFKLCVLCVYVVIVLASGRVFVCVCVCVCLRFVCDCLFVCSPRSFANKLIYTGKWVGDVPNGRGICAYPNGDRYDGMWRNGLRHGQVSMCDPVCKCVLMLTCKCLCVCLCV